MLMSIPYSSPAAPAPAPFVRSIPPEQHYITSGEGEFYGQKMTCGKLSKGNPWELDKSVVEEGEKEMIKTTPRADSG